MFRHDNQQMSSNKQIKILMSGPDDTNEASELPSSHGYTECGYTECIYWIYWTSPFPWIYTYKQSSSFWEKAWKTAECLPDTEQKRKYPQWNGWERLKHSLAINVNPGTTPLNQEGSSNSHLTSEDWRVWAIHPAPEVLRIPPKKWSPKPSGSKSQQALYSEPHRSSS